MAGAKSLPSMPLPRTILVADDNALLRESICDCLSGLGIDPRPAADGKSAIAILDRQRCDLVLSDVDMPDMSGFQLLAWIHQHPPEPPVVLMSARADLRLCARARQDGALTLLPKPLPVTEITRLVASIFPH